MKAQKKKKRPIIMSNHHHLLPTAFIQLLFEEKFELMDSNENEIVGS